MRKMPLGVVLFCALYIGCNSSRHADNDLGTIFDEIRVSITHQEWDIALEMLKFTQLRHAEYYYLLSHTYAGMALEQDRDSAGVNPEFYLKASEAMEKAISLDSSFSKIMDLNPYDKLGLIWGSLALSYLFENKYDKAQWCFEEGKQRGAFYEAYLDYGYNLLSSCQKNGILLTSGGIDTYAALYWQIVSNYRRDVTVICLQNLDNKKFVQHLSSRGVDFGLCDDFRASISNQKNPFTQPYLHQLKNAGFMITIPDRSQKELLFVQDVLLVNLVNANYRSRPIYFSSAVSKQGLYAFNNVLTLEGLVKRLTADVAGDAVEKRVCFESLEVNLLKTYNYDGLLNEHTSENKKSSELQNHYVSVLLSAINAFLFKEDYENAAPFISKLENVFHSVEGTIKVDF
ncbi:hypothetical protein QA601_11580 [Chitinispirillales bacterium ANBcel5]|uniref:hypothetical protein n=1 Tax=Cellulosispirillum alkaliphilum TaxID=3039283 RepID=UPI002A5973B0|nr:hypothetical protein [Chitinispirillales bacterium ANBcel5]